MTIILLLISSVTDMELEGANRSCGHPLLFSLVFSSTPSSYVLTNCHIPNNFL
uniref:Uncharacterized protein n=1 Tax=Anguilla anguilla TaxID=7936 RepID=A0A0E9SI77_ANGAN